MALSSRLILSNSASFASANHVLSDSDIADGPATPHHQQLVIHTPFKTGISPDFSHHIVCRLSGGGTGNKPIDWEQRLLHPASQEAHYTALVDACSSKDPRAVQALVSFLAESETINSIFEDVEKGTDFDATKLASLAAPIASELVAEMASYITRKLEAWDKHYADKEPPEAATEPIAGPGTPDDYYNLIGAHYFGAIPTVIESFGLLESFLDVFKTILRSDCHDVGDALRILDVISHHDMDEATNELEHYVLHGRWRMDFTLEALSEIFHTDNEDDVRYLTDLLKQRDNIEDEPDTPFAIPEMLKTSEQRAAYHLLSKRRDLKQLVFANTSALDVLKNKQSWITINDPQLAHDGLALVVDKAPRRRAQLDKLLYAAFDARVKGIGDDHFTYYADEILDTLVQFIGTSKLRSDPAIVQLLGAIRYAEGPKLRYARREHSDTKLGTKCGDCTSVGGIHFADSLMWYINPAYQILKLSKGKRFLGKINLTLGSMGGIESIIADATEFNPQAVKGMPYYNDALETFDVAVKFLRGLAHQQERELDWLKISNSSGAVEILRDRGKPAVGIDGKVVDKAHLVLPTEDMARTLALSGHEGAFKFFYQMAEEEEGVDTTIQGQDRMDAQLPELEQRVINPASNADEAVAAAMRERDFETASRLIMADEGRAATVAQIVGFPEGVALSPLFLKSRLEKIFAAQARDASQYEQPFPVNGYKFARL